eukprot:TRINITY_DN11322_c0_g1_i10.p2 TRINITY_DN11322_c0_g1~~TRINITY_DN11322_c0_g1_i10.p2  ORF type:complete len:108 (+),score=20.11 TRINITY_DN11322_c0_g1_i10:478-801(+)
MKEETSQLFRVPEIFFQTILETSQFNTSNRKQIQEFWWERIFNNNNKNSSARSAAKGANKKKTLHLSLEHSSSNLKETWRICAQKWLKTKISNFCPLDERNTRGYPS